MEPGLGSSIQGIHRNESNSNPDNETGPISDMDSAIPVQLIIKFSDSSVTDLTMEIPDITTASVSGVRRYIRDTVGGRMINRRLRLIHGGRVLNDSVSLARDVAKISVKGKEVSTGSSGSFPRRIYLHCSVGDILDATELAKENELDSSAPVRSTGPELRGFDRLRNAGFSDADISQLRRQFSHLHGEPSAGGAGGDGGGATGLPGTGPIPSATREEELSRLEEQWINTGVADAGINEGEAGLTPLGDDYLEELIGLLVGMFLGIMALIFLKEGGLFSRRQKRSILAGVAINFSFALVRMFN